MKITLAVLLGCVLVSQAFAVDPSGRITPQIQAILDGQKKVIAQWAANPTVVSAVKAQNAKGPLPHMSNRQWSVLQPDAPVVVAFQTNPAGKFLTQKLAAGKGLYREAFLSASHGEKVAFVSKPSRYVHAGQPKFMEPMSGHVWQGPPEWDKSSASHSVQIATPVLDHGKPIGVLVVGVSMKSLQMMSH